METQFRAHDYSYMEAELRAHAFGLDYALLIKTLIVDILGRRIYIEEIIDS